jgi:histidine triad (HIT) family protein
MHTTIFHKIINKEIEAEFLFENEGAIIINDKYPQAKYHYLIIPKKPYEDLKDFLNRAKQEEKNLFFDAIAHQLNKLESAKVQFNCGLDAGQEIMYLHAHIISNSNL